MSMSRFVNYFRYHLKRTLAIIFLALAVGFEIGSFAIGIISFVNGVDSSMSFIWNFLILIICYVRMLKGNLDDSGRALNGVMTFILLSMIDCVLTAATMIYINLSLLFTPVFYYFIILFVIYGGVAALGICTFIFFRRSMTGYSSMSLKGVKIMAGFFFAILIIANGFSSVVPLFFSDSVITFKMAFLASLSTIGQFFASIGAWITISRIR